MMELTEDFLKLLQTAFIVVGVLAIFFTYISYNIFVSQDRVEREAIILGNSLLDNDCLTYSNTKSLFSEEKLDSITPSCINYYTNFTVSIELLEDIGKGPWLIGVGNVVYWETEFIVAVKLRTGEIKLAKMIVDVKE